MAEWLKRIQRFLAGGASSLEAIPDGALIVDVRTAGEYRGDHFPGAVNIPVQEIGRRLSELGEKGRTIVVYCRSGHRSAAAKAQLDRAGFRDVLNGGPLGAMMRLASKDRM